MTRVQGQRKFAVDKPEPESLGVYQQQTSNDRGQGSYVRMFVVYTVMTVVHMIYYDEVILGYIMVYYTTKTCNYV